LLTWLCCTSRLKHSHTVQPAFNRPRREPCVSFRYWIPCRTYANREMRVRCLVGARVRFVSSKCRLRIPIGGQYSARSRLIFLRARVWLWLALPVPGRPHSHPCYSGYMTLTPDASRWTAQTSAV